MNFGGKNPNRETAAQLRSYKNCMHMIYLNLKGLDLKPEVSEG